MDEESLDSWAARRDRRRASDRQVTGTRRALPLAPGANAAHVAPDAPRLLVECEEAGGAWVPVGVAVNAAAAAVFLQGATPPASGGSRAGGPA